MFRIGNALIDVTSVVEAHANSKKGYLKVTYKAGNSVIYNADVIQCPAEYALNALNEQIASISEPEKKEEKLGVKDMFMMNMVQNMMNPNK